jgi:hypothetical protein
MSRVLFPVSAILIVILLIATALFYATVPPPNVPSIENNTAIYIHATANHATTQHGSEMVNRILDCLRQKGSSAVMSERFGGNLHWLCIDTDGNVLDLITRMLTKTISNPSGETEIVTAYKPDPVKTLQEYVVHLERTQGSKLVNLFMKPSGIIFGP